MRINQYTLLLVSKYWQEALLGFLGLVSSVDIVFDAVTGGSLRQRWSIYGYEIFKQKNEEFHYFFSWSDHLK